MNERRAGTLAAAGAATLFGSSYVATAFALRSFGPLPIAFWRGFAALVLMSLVLRSGLFGDRTPLSSLGRRAIARLIALGVLGGPIFTVALNVAVGSAGATVAAFVAGLYAVLAAVLAPFALQERLGTGAIAGFIVALIGTALLAQLDAASGSSGGIAAGLVAATAFAAYLVLARRWTRGNRLPSTLIAQANFAASALALLPIILIAGPDRILPTAIDPVAVLALVWLAVGAGVTAQLLVIGSVQRVPARVSSAVLLLNPIVAASLAALLLGERLSPLQLGGAALVLVGIALAGGLGEVLGSRGLAEGSPDRA